MSNRVRLVRYVACLCAAAVIATGAGCSPTSTNAPPAPGTTRASIGIAANPSDFDFPDSVGSAIFTARDLGCDMMQLGELWSTLERSPGVIQLGTLPQTLGVLRTLGLTPYFNLRLVDTNQRGVPADLAATAWTDPALVARVDAMVDTLIAVFTLEPPLAFSFGNEVDAYFGANPSELPAFRALLQREIGRIHARLPALLVGCCTQSPPLNPTAWVGDTLNRYTDLAIYTYYPFQPASDFLHRPASTFEPDMAAMIARNPGKPIGMQEVGYSSSPVNASNAATQADVVRRFRRYMATVPRSRVLFASWFLMTDWSSGTLNTLFGYYGFVSPGFSAFLGGLGMRDSLGTPKPAWEAWRNP